MKNGSDKQEEERVLGQDVRLCVKLSLVNSVCQFQIGIQAFKIKKEEERSNVSGV